MHTVAKGPIVGPGASSEELPELDEDDEATMHFGRSMAESLHQALTTADEAPFEDDATAVGTNLGSFDDETIVKPTPGVIEALRAPVRPASAPLPSGDEPSFEDATLVRAMPDADEPAMPLLLQRRKDGGPASVPPPPPAPTDPLRPASVPPRASQPPSKSRLPTASASPTQPSSTAADRTSLLPARAASQARSNARIFWGILCVLVATAAGLGLGHFAAKRNGAQSTEPNSSARP